MSIITDQDLFLFNEGTHNKIYLKLGAHVIQQDGVWGTQFSVWAPNAHAVYVFGDFCDWDKFKHPMVMKGESGIWEAFLPGIGKGAHYKYWIESQHNFYRVEKSDPVGFYHECPPKTASIVWPLEYQWNDEEWMQNRYKVNNLEAPVSIYEVHLGSWMHVPEEDNRSLTYREAAHRLAAYAKEMNFTHVELMPIMEYPFYGSWGYQTTGYFAPTSRFGTPDDFAYFVDHLHQEGIGVILDWVPSHFPTDSHGLAYFDGTHLFEHSDPRQGFHPDWKSAIFNYGRHEVRSFLLSSALFWIDRFHVDGIRVDAVASMLYLDYSRKAGEWTPNQFGGRENLEAIHFLRRLNEDCYKERGDILMIAEESTAWQGVSRPTYTGGLGFGLKWDMGWMHDTLEYFQKNPVFRRYHQGTITFRAIYAFTENFCLPLSHDEVVHGKGSLLKMMGGCNDWEKFANLRLLFGYMFASPGKKLMFMGNEIAQWEEWNHNSSIDWHLLQNGLHHGVKQWVQDMNFMLRNEPALHEKDCSAEGFEWIDFRDSDNSVLSFLRKSPSNGDMILCIFNLTPMPRHNYRVGVPRGGFWRELLCSDNWCYGGSGLGNCGGFNSDWTRAGDWNDSLNLTLPPLSVSFFKYIG